MAADKNMAAGEIKFAAEAGLGGDDGAYDREIFKDTAHFETIILDEKGHGELRFKLPDNVTSWRVTLSGATSDLYAGSNKTSLNVTLPFFINYTMNCFETFGRKDRSFCGRQPFRPHGSLCYL
jgi:uncharacterized protein YfaS (alpha-2-macroglobulin family)